MQGSRESPPGDLLSASELAQMMGIRRCVIERMVRLELIRPETTGPETVFAPRVVPRVRRLCRLHYQLDVSWSSMGLVLELLDRIEHLEARLRDSL